MTMPSDTPRTVRPFYWSVRREIWEHHALYVAPLAAKPASCCSAS